MYDKFTKTNLWIMFINMILHVTSAFLDWIVTSDKSLSYKLVGICYNVENSTCYSYRESVNFKENAEDFPYIFAFLITSYTLNALSLLISFTKSSRQKKFGGRRLFLVIECSVITMQFLSFFADIALLTLIITLDTPPSNASYASGYYLACVSCGVGAVSVIANSVEFYRWRNYHKTLAVPDIILENTSQENNVVYISQEL